jgi:hypothetical protein
VSSQPPPPENLVGTTVDKCRILAKLGVGGMGSVWLAEHFGLNRKVAVKILPSEMGRDPEYVARFMREATTAGKLEHPNIVQVYDVGYSDHRHYIVMQFVDGESLSTVVEHLGAMEPQDAARTAAGILRGLHHAHQQGIVHRDVKPDNVLIAQGDQPKLLDFGLAIETESALQITKDGMVVGTPFYLSPEQAKGKKATPLSDQYSVGVTLYYLLTGKRPFTAATALAVLNQQIHETPVPPIKHRPAIPQALNNIVLKMMSKRPEERYADCEAAAADLDAFIGGRKVVAPTVRRVIRLSELTKPQKILAASVAGGVLLLLLLLLAFSGGDEAPAAAGTASTSTPTPVPAAPTADPALLAILAEEERLRADYAAWPKILQSYDDYLAATTDEKLTEKGKAARDKFFDLVNKTAQEEFDRALREADPVLRLRAMDDYPKVLKALTTIDGRLREERPKVLEEIEIRFGESEAKLDQALEDGRFGEAGKLIDDLLRSADGVKRAADDVRRTRLVKLQADLPKREREFEDQVLRKLTAEFAKVHDAAEKALQKRLVPEGFGAVAGWLSGISQEAQRSRVRVPTGANYDALLGLFTGGRPDLLRLGTIRGSLVLAFGKAQDTLPFRVLSDLQDALDLEYLNRAAGQSLELLVQDKKSPLMRFETYGGEGRVVSSALLWEFAPKSGPSKQIKLADLHPADLLMLAARAENLTVEQVRSGNELLCRAAGTAYLHSTVPERWAKAFDWFRRAGELGAPGLEFRLEGFRERGYKEVRERVVRAQAAARAKRYAEARKLLDEVSGPWSHDGPLKLEIDRALANVLAAELRELVGAKDWARALKVVRLLRESHEGHYDAESLYPLFARVLRESGFWAPLSISPAAPHWTWAGTAEGPLPPLRGRRRPRGRPQGPARRLGLQRRSPDRRPVEALPGGLHVRPGPRREPAPDAGDPEPRRGGPLRGDREGRGPRRLPAAGAARDVVPLGGPLGDRRRRRPRLPGRPQTGDPPPPGRHDGPQLLAHDEERGLLPHPRAAPAEVTRVKWGIRNRECGRGGSSQPSASPSRPRPTGFPPANPTASQAHLTRW